MLSIWSLSDSKQTIYNYSTVYTQLHQKHLNLNLIPKYKENQLLFVGFSPHINLARTTSKQGHELS